MGRKRSKEKSRKKEPKATGSYLDPKDEFLYSPNKITIRDLAKRWKGKKGCSHSVLSKKAWREGWVERREEIWKDIRAKVRDEYVSEIATKMKDSIVDANERHINHGQVMQGVGVKTIKQFHEKVGSIEKPENALRVASTMIKNGVDIERKALGLADRVVKIKFAKEIGKEFVQIVTKYVHDEEVLSNIAREIDGVVEKKTDELEDILDELDAGPTGKSSLH